MVTINDLPSDAEAELDKLIQAGLSESEGFQFLACCDEYKQTFILLGQYDEEGEITQEFPSDEGQNYRINAGKAKLIVDNFKQFLAERGQIVDNFGLPRNGGVEEIIGNIYQTAGKKDVYPTILDKAIQLFYFLIKDHLFVDGNKRIAALLFIWFLEMNGWMMHESKKEIFSFHTLYALAIFVAESDSREKDKVVKLVRNIIVARASAG